MTEKKLNRWCMKATKGAMLLVLKSMTNYMYACAHCTEIIRDSHCSQLNTSHLSVRRDEVSDGQWDVD